MIQMIVFSMIVFKKPILLNLTQLKEVNMETDVVLNMKLLNIDVITVIYQQKVIVLSNVLSI